MARPGAVLIQLNPANIIAPPWNEELPAPLRLESYPYDGMYEAVKRRLESANLTFHSTWLFDRPEMFDDVTELYHRLSWGHAADEVPSLGEIGPVLDRIFAGYARAGSLAVPHGRFLWTSIVDA